MNIKASLLNGKSFRVLLQQYALRAEDIKIQHEELLMRGKQVRKDIWKEDICIEGKNDQGMLNLLGVLHYNLVDDLAVFEMQAIEHIN